MHAESRTKNALDLYGQSIARRFRTESVKTAFAQTVSKDPIAIANIVRSQHCGRWTETSPPEAAFSVHLCMVSLPRVQTFIDGRHATLNPLEAGDVCLFDLATSPMVLIQDPMDSIRIEMSQRTLDDLAYDRGQRSPGGLKPTFGGSDPVLHGLCLAFKHRLDVYGDDNALFLDHAALAFHAHVAETYGQLPGRFDRGGLAPWQLRRVRELMAAKLSEGVTIAELAEVCGLSASYFSRAFRRSTGATAHRWLMAQRIEQAKVLLAEGELPVSEVALACGFTDQSHLTRVFSLMEGHTPARWRRLRQN